MNISNPLGRVLLMPWHARLILVLLANACLCCGPCPSYCVYACVGKFGYSYSTYVGVHVCVLMFPALDSGFFVDHPSFPHSPVSQVCQGYSPFFNLFTSPRFSPLHVQYLHVHVP